MSRFCDEKTLRALREAVSRPVFDAFEPAVLLSLALGERIGILTWPQSMVPLIKRRVGGTALEQRIVSVREVRPAPVAYERGALLEAAKTAIGVDGAQVLIIGRSFWQGEVGEKADFGLAARLEKDLAGMPEYAVPVVDANRTAARWLEMCVHMGYFHSRRTYLVPPAK